MKRLTKKADFFKAYNDNNGNYFECFKNPTRKEFDEILSSDLELIYPDANKVRGMLLEDGTLYIWHSNLTHAEASSVFSIPNKVRLVFYDTNSFAMYADYNDIDFEYIQSAFKNSTALYNYLNKTAELEEIGYSDDYLFNPLTDYDNHDIITIQDILDYKKT